MNSNAQGLGPLTPFHPPAIQKLRNYSVNREGQFEVIWNPLYDYQAYAMAGATQFTFFQNPIGQAGNTLADTNMRSAGQLPRPQEFLVTGIQVLFLPGNAVASSQNAAGTAQENWNDVFDVMFGDAWLELFIGSKPYVQDGPLAKFTQQFRLTGGGWTTGAGSVATTDFIDYAVHAGRYYAITPVKLTANQNFSVTANFPTAIGVSVAATIGVILDGFLYRLSQ